MPSRVNRSAYRTGFQLRSNDDEYLGLIFFKIDFHVLSLVMKLPVGCKLSQVVGPIGGAGTRGCKYWVATFRRESE